MVREWLRLKPQEIEPVFCAINHGRCEERAICERNVNDIIKRGLDDVHSAVQVFLMQTNGLYSAVGKIFVSPS